MYDKTKTMYKQLKFLHTEAAINGCSTKKMLDNYDQKT